MTERGRVRAVLAGAIRQALRTPEAASRPLLLSAAVMGTPEAEGRAARVGVTRRDGGRVAPHTRPVWGEYRSDNGTTRASPRAIHEHPALVFFTKGEVLFEQRGQLAVRAGDVLLVPAGEPHRVQSSQAWACWGIGFCASCYAPTELASVLDPFERARAGASAVVHIPSDRQEYLARLCAELHAETSAERAASPHAELVQKSLLALVLAEISRAASTTSSAGSQPTLVGDALRFIERHCLEPISLRDVAAAVHRSPSYVSTALRRATGKTVVEWIISGRLSEARNRLLHTDEMVDIIAERVGYADATHFIRLFRRAHGVTPAAWRAERRRAATPSR